MYPNRLLLSSDYGTLKNDSHGNTLAVTITSGTVFNISSPILGTATLDAGTINAGIRARGVSSKYPTVQTIGTSLYSDVLYSIPSIPAAGIQTTTLYCNLERISAGTARLTVAVAGGSGAPNFKLEETQTITFVFSTLLSPFD